MKPHVMLVSAEFRPYQSSLWAKISCSLKSQFWVFEHVSSAIAARAAQESFRRTTESFGMSLGRLGKGNSLEQATSPEDLARKFEAACVLFGWFFCLKFFAKNRFKIDNRRLLKAL
jgi:hypothetical protein